MTKLVSTPRTNALRDSILDDVIAERKPKRDPLFRFDELCTEIETELSSANAQLAEYKRDAERMNWLDVGNRFVMRRVCDEIRSDHCVGMAVGFYVKGKYKIVEGHTVRAAIDAAMDQTEQKA